MNKKQAKSFWEIRNIKKLYRKAFPLCERKPFSIIRAMQKKGKTDLWYYEDEGRFVGFASTINGDDRILLDYLAVDEKARCQGYGSAILCDLKEYYGKERLFLEIEAPTEDSPNRQERERRRQFYLRCGMEEMHLTVHIFSTDMELLSFGCQLTFEEYREFYRKHYSEFAAKHIFRQGENPAVEGKRPKKL